MPQLQLLNERGIHVYHSTMSRSVQRYGRKLDPLQPKHLKLANRPGVDDRVQGRCCYRMCRCAMAELQHNGTLRRRCCQKPVQYLNSIIYRSTTGHSRSL